MGFVLFFSCPFSRKEKENIETEAWVHTYLHGFINED